MPESEEQAPVEAPEELPEDALPNQQPPDAATSSDDRSHLISALERLKRGGQKIRGWRGGGKPPGTAKLARPGSQAATGSRAAAKAGAQAAKAAAKAAARAAATAAKVAARAVASFLVSTFPVWGPIVAVIAIIVIIIILIISIFNLSGGQGGGLPVTPTTAEQKSQATLLAALGGDNIAKDKIVLDTVESEKSRYQRILENVRRYAAARVGDVESKSREFGALLDQLAAEKDPQARLAIKEDVQQKMLEFEATLPFGRWIAAIANGHVNKRTDFCLVTGASTKRACASFASTVLWQAGVPNIRVSTTTAVWNSKALRLIIDRQDMPPARKTVDLTVLQPGDVIWFGNGEIAKSQGRGGPNPLFEHVGIYVGDGKVVDTKSSEEIVVKRNVWFGGKGGFNGAKRYGANL